MNRFLAIFTIVTWALGIIAPFIGYGEVRQLMWAFASGVGAGWAILILLNRRIS